MRHRRPSAHTGATTSVAPGPKLETQARLRRAAAAADATTAADAAASMATAAAALRRAAETGATAVVLQLLSFGADPDAVDRYGRSAAWLAASANRTAALGALADAGADVDTPDWTGMTPLMSAACAGSAAAVERLLEHGADPHATDKFGCTALDGARLNRRPEAAAVLENLADETEFKARLSLSAKDGDDEGRQLQKAKDILNRVRQREMTLCWTHWREYITGVRTMRRAVQRMEARARLQTIASLWQRWVGFLAETQQQYDEAAWADKVHVLAAVARDGMLLRFATATLRAHKDIVMAAVEENGGALQYTRMRQNADKRVVIAAVASNGLALEHATAVLQDDKEVAMVAVAADGLALRFVSDRLTSDEGVKAVARAAVFATLKKDADALALAPAALQADKLFVLRAVERDGLAIRHAFCRPERGSRSGAGRSDAKWLGAALSFRGFAG